MAANHDVQRTHSSVTIFTVGRGARVCSFAKPYPRRATSGARKLDEPYVSSVRVSDFSVRVRFMLAS